MNLAIFAKQEIVRRYRESFGSSEISVSIPLEVLMKAEEEYQRIINDSSQVHESTESLQQERYSQPAEDPIFLFKKEIPLFDTSLDNKFSEILSNAGILSFLCYVSDSLETVSNYLLIDLRNLKARFKRKFNLKLQSFFMRT